MNWEKKMDNTVKDILGIEYTCVVKSDNLFSIFENNDVVFTRTASHMISNHWRADVTDAILKIISEKIINSMKKYDN